MATTNESKLKLQAMETLMSAMTYPEQVSDSQRDTALAVLGLVLGYEVADQDLKDVAEVAESEKGKVSAMKAQSDFLYYLRDAIVLLGGRVDIADKLDHMSDISEADVDDLRQYGINLEEDLKRRQELQHKMTIRVGHPE